MVEGTLTWKEAEAREPALHGGQSLQEKVRLLASATECNEVAHGVNPEQGQGWGSMVATAWREGDLLMLRMFVQRVRHVLPGTVPGVV